MGSQTFKTALYLIVLLYLSLTLNVHIISLSLSLPLSKSKNSSVSLYLCMKTMKSPAKIGESRFLGNISTSSIRNLLPRSIYAKQKSIQSQSFRSNDENAPPCDPNALTPHSDLQLKNKSPQKVFPSTPPEEHTQVQIHYLRSF